MCVGLPEYSAEGRSRCVCNAELFEVVAADSVSCKSK